MYVPTKWDWMTYAGTIGFFMLLIFLFVRLLPSISIFEVREELHHAKHAKHEVEEVV
jgi:molybdopterin-containing oxidoreductase family membrane subunit